MRLAILSVPLWLTLCIATSFTSNAINNEDTPKVQLKKSDSQHLPNLIQVNDQVYSGGLPEGEAAFEELRQLGIRTIISVDGARPNVELAEKVGLKYAHLPHGYDGISGSRSKELAKALKDLPGPVYIHCHHGKHRSPAATAVACVGIGWMNKEQATELLKLAGTDPKYKGLFRSVQVAAKIDQTELDHLKVEFPSIANLPPMAHAMVEIEELFEHLQRLQKNQWQAVSHGKHSPQQTALLLQEQFRELLRIDDVRIKDVNFVRMSQESESGAAAIERELNNASISQGAITTLDQALKQIERNCKACHQAVRN